MYSIVIVLYSGVSVCVEAEGVGMTDAGMAGMAHLVRGGRPLLGGCTLVRLPSTNITSYHEDGEYIVCS